MYILSCLEGEMSVAQLAEVSATSLEETERRLRGLAHLGLVEGLDGELEKPPARARKAARPKLSRAVKPGPAKPELTMRPPPPSDADLDALETLRPLSNAPADLERITSLRPIALDALFQAEPTGALLKLLTPSRGHPLEEVKIPRKRR